MGGGKKEEDEEQEHEQGQAAKRSHAPYADKEEDDEGSEEDSEEDEEEEDPLFGLPLPRVEKLLIAWGVLSGIVHIFFQGTYVIFNTVVNRSDLWLVSAWRLMGKVDSRYLHGDAFIVIIEGMFALVIGPICLLFAYALYSRRSFRYIVGITATTLQMYSQLLYVGMEFVTNFKHIASPTYFILISIALRLLLPIPILIYCLRKSNKSMETIEGLINMRRIRSKLLSPWRSHQTSEDDEEDDGEGTKKKRKKKWGNSLNLPKLPKANFPRRPFQSHTSPESDIRQRKQELVTYGELTL